jgi:hypothetical protein
MRFLSAIVLAGVLFGASAGESRAQFYYQSSGSVVNPYVVNPYVTPYVAPVVPPAYGYGAVVSPYGYQSAYNYGMYPTPWGYNTFYNYGTQVRPYMTAPFHSVYFDPFRNTYRYGPGYVNTPRYVWRYGF